MAWREDTCEVGGHPSGSSAPPRITRAPAQKERRPETSWKFLVAGASQCFVDGPELSGGGIWRNFPEGWTLGWFQQCHFQLALAQGPCVMCKTSVILYIPYFAGMFGARLSPSGPTGQLVWREAASVTPGQPRPLHTTEVSRITCCPLVRTAGVPTVLATSGTLHGPNATAGESLAGFWVPRQTPYPRFPGSLFAYPTQKVNPAGQSQPAIIAPNMGISWNDSVTSNFPVRSKIQVGMYSFRSP